MLPRFTILRSRLRGLPILIALSALSGCVTAHLSPPTVLVRDAIPSLIAGEFPSVTVHKVPPQKSSGSLFALLIVPVGSVVVSNPEIGIGDAITRAIVKNPPDHPINGVELAINSLDLSAYDLLITRRIVCSIDASIRIISAARKPIPHPLPVNISISRYRALAFTPQLERVGRECFEEFGKAIVRSISEIP